ncbi:MAG: hypothetical protein OK455_10140 [Thaumarchaeota archaeon]|nr:hypothetical protein [Nitrososphaerota archaeon]
MAVLAILVVAAVAGIAGLFAVTLSGSSSVSSGSTLSSTSSSTPSSTVYPLATRTIEAETTYHTTTFSNSSSSVVTITNGSQSGGPNPYAPCVIAGQPGGFHFRVLSDSSSAPVVGANITAFHIQANDSCNGVFHPGDFTVAHFQTDGSLWYWLDDSNAGIYNFTLTYLGHSVSIVSPQMKPITGSCVTLYLPSGRTDSTYVDGGSSCG